MNIKILAVATAFGIAAFGQTANATSTNLITNGNFDSTSFVNNSQFGSNGASGNGGQGVTGWTGGSGYELYFFNGTQATNSAASQYDGGIYNSGSEKFYVLPNSPTGGTGNFVALDGDPNVAGSISQTLSGLTIGSHYLLTFYTATGQLQSYTGGPFQTDVLASLGGQSFQTTTVTTQSQSDTPWVANTFLYKATATTETLTFLAQSPQGLPPMIALDGVSLVAAPEPSSFALLGAGIGLLGFVARRRRRAAGA
jgi:hypothetical protein